jgi:hypothetical protein
VADPLLTPDPLTTRYAQALLDQPEGSTALDVLRAVTDLKVRLALFEVQVVAAARREGRTWEEIGNVVGMTRQNTFRKFRAVSGADRP